MLAIETKGLTKKYKDVTAVDALDLTVEKGELFALLGVNGAGKTTTVKLLSCLTKPTAGDALLIGRSILTDTAGVKEVIGMSPQETAVAPNLTVQENLALMCGVHGFSRGTSRERTEELLERFGQEMGRGVPEGVLAFGVVPLEELNGRIGFDRTVNVPLGAVDVGCKHVAGELGAEGFGHLEGCNAGFESLHAIIGKRNVYHIRLKR